MNVRPLNYTWDEFYDRVIDLTSYSFSWRAMARRFRANRGGIPRWMNVVRGVSSEGFGRLRNFRRLRRQLEDDPEMRAFFAGESQRVPSYYSDTVLRELGPLRKWLPAGALHHDPQAYLKGQRDNAAPPAASVTMARSRAGLADAG
jgi:hypothetical protein